ncbi:hypothetical protein P872_03310 [Rhodonellum psychrophilum GCM71 = DSM 17998]|uniref:Uncharacterized protein n=1 Tax=Rhodonellum psychrophilum GCM71 = DSM 17998 TaxID=1123057 RepID=U5BS54_9BACT|nr:hypothetical protein P872_03310 [Rhodonellum psychrophilum GCM71 = DSM 17998]
MNIWVLLNDCRNIAEKNKRDNFLPLYCKLISLISVSD